VIEILKYILSMITLHWSKCHCLTRKSLFKKYLVLVKQVLLIICHY